MTSTVTNQVLLQIVAGTVPHFINGFLTKRQSRGLSKHTIKYCRNELSYFREYLGGIGVVELAEVTSDLIRHYLLNLGKRPNQGVVHLAFRAIKAWVNWIWDEFDIEERNPITHVKKPISDDRILLGLDFDDAQKIINAWATYLALQD